MTVSKNRGASAALLALIVLQLIMLTALYAKVAPHPPATTPLFGIAPFIGAALAAAICALYLGATETKSAQLLSLLAAILAAVSFGPQKYLDVQFPLIWPAVLAGQIAIMVLCISLFQKMRHPRGLVA